MINTALKSRKIFGKNFSTLQRCEPLFAFDNQWRQFLSLK